MKLLSGQIVSSITKINAQIRIKRQANYHSVNITVFDMISYKYIKSSLFQQLERACTNCSGACFFISSKKRLYNSKLYISQSED